MDYSPSIHKTQACFRTLLQAMSHPGCVHHMTMDTGAHTHETIQVMLSTLLDPEVSFWMEQCPDSDLDERHVCHATGSAFVEPEKADFLIILGSDSRQAVERARKGSPEYPETGATLIYYLSQDARNNSQQSKIRLKGPGIPPGSGKYPELNLIPVSEWKKIKAANEDFPLGLDCIFITNRGQIMAVPRSTRITFEPVLQTAVPQGE